MTHKHLVSLVAPVDALLLKGDGDPRTRAIMGTALVLDRAPDFDGLVEAFTRATAALPLMRSQVTRTAWSLGQPQWVPDHQFDVRDHVREVGAPGDRDLDAVLKMASTTATAPFDAARPLWDATLVTGMVDGHAVLLLRAHHAIADGVRALEMMAYLLDLEPSPSKPDVPALEQRGSSLRRASTQRVRALSETVRRRRRDARTSTLAALRSSLNPLASVSGAASYARSVARTFGSGAAEPSELLRGRSRARTFATVDLSLDDMRRSAKRNAATINDVFLAGLLGGIRLYHEAFGATVADTPLSFPIDVSGGHTPDGGNHFSAAVIPGPSSIADPQERVRAVRHLVAAKRVEPGLDAPQRLAPMLHHVPAWLAAAGLTAYARRIDIQASNVVGPDCAVFLAGAAVDRFYAFGPLPGVPAMAVLISYNGLCTIGFTIDPAAIRDHNAFVTAMRQSFAELLDPASHPPGET